jgi:GAF domain-containing protein/histidine kinase
MAVSEEVANLFGEGLAAVCRFDEDRSALTFVALSTDAAGVELGTHVEVGEDTAAGLVYATGRPARIDRTDWSTARSDIGRIANQLGLVSTVSNPIVVEGRLWGVVSAIGRTGPLPADTAGRLERFSELIAMAIANSESKTALAASRRRIVTASDDARRRIERNLHDGTQQRLVSLGLSVRAAEADVPPELGSLRSQLSKIATGIADAAAELQEDLARHSSGESGAERDRCGLANIGSPLADSRRCRGHHRLPAPGTGRGRRVLCRVRGAHQRGEACTGDTRRRLASMAR